MLRTKVIFYGEGLLASHHIPKMQGHPLSFVRGCLFNIFAATLHLEAVPPSATRGCAMLWGQGPT
jgi:hypothetical protein